MQNREIRYSCELHIVDKNGKALHPRTAQTLWVEAVDPLVGDELMLSYHLNLRGREAAHNRILEVKIVKRKLYFHGPTTTSSEETGCHLGGSFLILHAVPTAKNGGLAGVKRFLSYVRSLKKKAG